MDNFLRDQITGQVVDTDNSFTISRVKARAKTLESAPKAQSGTYFRLLDSALIELGFNPSDCITHRRSTKYTSEYLVVVIPGLGPEKIEILINELRAPFGGERSLRRLAQALLLAACNGEKVHLTLDGPKLSLIGSYGSLHLSTRTLDIPDSLTAGDANSITLELPTLASYYPSYRSSLSRALLRSVHNSCEAILPLESLSSRVTGFFDGRVEPFTAIRSYAYQTDEEQVSPSLSLDLWTGPYSELDSSTVLIEKKPSKGFLFLRWRPDYGRPTLLHHGLDSPLLFGPQSCRGSFMIGPVDEPAQVLFCSEGIVADPVFIEGPRGFIGLVSWPGFRYDLWGSSPVKDDVYEAAVAWAETQAKATAECLAKNLEQVIERVCGSRLLAANYYADEVAARMRTLWGPNRES